MPLRCRGSLGTCLLLSASSLLPPPVMAQEKRFHPSLSLRYRYTNNVQFAGAEGGDAPDQVAALDLVLPFEAIGERTTTALSYRAALQRFDSFSSLDNTAHWLRLDVTNQLGHKSSMFFNTSYTRSQAQGDPDLESLDLFLGRRTQRQSVSAALGGSVRVAPRWDVASSFRAAYLNLEPISGFDQGLTPADVEDRLQYTVLVSATRLQSASRTLGVYYTYRWFDVEFSGTEPIHQFGFNDFYEFSRRLNFSYSIGASYRPDNPQITGRAVLNSPFNRVVLSVIARHSPSVGGTLAGTSTDSSLGVQVTGRTEARWSWAASARYAHRDPTDPADPTVSALNSGASLEWRPVSAIGLRTSFLITRQQQFGDNELTGSFATVFVGVIWYPLGPRSKREVE